MRRIELRFVNADGAGLRPATETLTVIRVFVEANVLVLQTDRDVYRYIPLAQLREWRVNE